MSREQEPLGPGSLTWTYFGDTRMAPVGPRAAPATGRTVRDFHTGIKGTFPDGERYHALDPETYYWAHATFVDTMLYGIVAHKTARYGVGYVTKGIPRPARVPASVWRLVSPALNAAARFVTVGGMHPRMRELLGLPWSAVDQRRYSRFAALVRRLDPVWRRLPEQIRYVPQARKAFARDGHPARR